jgi:sporulation protein YlmC with PRC-barrel domain
MKSKSLFFIPSASLALAVGLAWAPVSRAQLPSPGQPGYQPVELGTPQHHDFAVGHLAGQPVRAANQEELGKISDFLIDPQSGRVHFAVTTGGGNIFRIVPMSALQPGSGSSGLKLALDRAQWDQINTMTEQELLNRVAIDSTRQQQLQQQFRLGAAEPPAENLIRSMLLNEREVRAGNERVGKVDDVIIDFHNRICAPLVKVSGMSGFGVEGQR